MEPTPPRRLNLSGVLCESGRILIANYGHFIGLSFLFLPLCFYLITTPIFRLSGQLFTGDHFHKFPQIHQNSIISHIFYILIVYLLSLCAIATITYSTYHGFSGKPVNFFTAVKSLTSSFFPIVTTAIIAHSLLFIISLGFLLFVGTNLMLVRNLGFVIDHNSIHFMWFSAVVGAILIVIVTYLHVNWSLAFVVVIVESKSGIMALIRSSYLVNGMRSVSLLLVLYFGFIFGNSVWVMSDGVHALSDRRYMSFAVVLFFMVAGSGLLMSYMRYCTAATTVLYNYCKAFHGESETDGFGHNYVNLPSDDEKVPLVVGA